MHGLLAPQPKSPSFITLRAADLYELVNFAPGDASREGNAGKAYIRLTAGAESTASALNQDTLFIMGPHTCELLLQPEGHKELLPLKVHTRAFSGAWEFADALESQCYLVRPERRQIVRLSPCPFTQRRGAVSAFNHCVYVVGGCGPEGEILNLCTTYHPRIDCWLRIADLPQKMRDIKLFHADTGADALLLFAVGLSVAQSELAKSQKGHVVIQSYNMRQNYWTLLSEGASATFTEGGGFHVTPLRSDCLMIYNNQLSTLLFYLIKKNVLRQVTATGHWAEPTSQLISVPQSSLIILHQPNKKGDSYQFADAACVCVQPDT